MTTAEDDYLDVQVADGLRTWARGRLPLEAAVGLLATACAGRLLNGPWSRRDKHGRRWFSPGLAVSEKGFLSGGERRVLEVAMSLVSSDHPVDLSDAICGLDPTDLGAVLAAISHAGGSDHPWPRNCPQARPSPTSPRTIGRSGK